MATNTSASKIVLVTGANGFIGTRLCENLSENRVNVRRAMRAAERNDDFAVRELTADIDWSEAVKGVDCVIHLAGIVHVANGKNAILLDDYRRVNVDATTNLAMHAAKCGVRRFIFLSSIKVHGESSIPGKPIHVDWQPQPLDPYAISKWEAEQNLFRISVESDMEVVCVRPPLVYGPCVKANFLRMMRWLYKGIPLPFGAVHNKRSLVNLDNLVDLIVACIDHPAAANQVFLVSDGEDLSTPELMQRTATALGKKARLLNIPQGVLEFGLKMLGKHDLAQRLCGSLQVDITKTRELLDWNPPVSVDEGLSKTADAYKLSLNE